MVTIRRISIGSAFRVGALVSAFLALLTGIIMFLFQSLITTAIVGFLASDGSFQRSGTSDAVAAASLATFCIFYIMYIIFAGIFGGIGGALTAFAYNLVSGWVGGLEVELDGLEKSKRSLGSDGEIFE